MEAYRYECGHVVAPPNEPPEDCPKCEWARENLTENGRDSVEGDQ